MPETAIYFLITETNSGVLCKSPLKCHLNEFLILRILFKPTEFSTKRLQYVSKQDSLTTIPLVSYFRKLKK